MTTYLTTPEEAKKSATQAKLDNFNTYIEKGSYQCDCGESYSCSLIDSKTLNTLEVFVACEHCHNNN